MPKPTEKHSKPYLALSIPQNILVIINSIVALAFTAQIIFQPLYIMIAPLLLVVAAFCIIPLLKSNTHYSKPYVYAQIFLAFIATIEVLYLGVQLINDHTGVRCEGIMGGQASCVDSTGLSIWGVATFMSIPVATFCAYGIYTQLRLPK